MERTIKPTKELEIDDCIETTRIVLSERSGTEASSDLNRPLKNGCCSEPMANDESSSVDLVTEESTAESSIANSANEKFSSNEPSSEGPKTKKTSFAEPLFDSTDEPNHYSMPHVPFVTGGIDNFSTQSSRFDKKQFLNLLYFALGAAGVAVTAYAYEAFPLYTLSGIFALVALTAAVCSIRHKTFATTPEVYLSNRTRKMVRIVALLLPIPFIVTAVSWCTTYQIIVESDNAYTAGNYDRSLRDLSYAEITNLAGPLTESIATRRAANYWQKQDVPKALHYADDAIKLDPKDGYAWSTKAAAMLRSLQVGNDIHYLQPLKPNSDLPFNETIIAANNAVSLYPENGENFRVQAYVDAHEGLFDQALAAAQRHAKMHSGEAGAHQLNAEIYEKMGRYNDALREANTSVAMVGHRDGSDPAYQYRGELLEKMGRAEEAQKDFDVATDTTAPPSTDQPVAADE